MSDALNILFVGADGEAFSRAAEALAADGHHVRRLANPFKALTENARSPAALTVIDVSRLDDQMLDVFEALKDVAPAGLLLAAVTPASKARAARVLNLGSDAIIALPAEADEIRALLKKLRVGKAGRISVDEKFRWLGEFAGGIAHNINNPLTTVMGYLQILCSRVDAPEHDASVLPTMLKECDRISDIVRSLLLFSGQGNIEPRPVDVNRAVDAALMRITSGNGNHTIRIERSYHPGLPAVMADEEALRLACENIAVNAQQAMSDGGILSVETTENDEGRVIIRFTDSGPGIPPERLDRIFEPFYAGGGNGRVGLGLATSYGIVKGFGGTLHAASNEGGGATFTVELPASL